MPLRSCGLRARSAAACRSAAIRSARGGNLHRPELIQRLPAGVVQQQMDVEVRVQHIGPWVIGDPGNDRFEVPVGLPQGAELVRLAMRPLEPLDALLQLDKGLDVSQARAAHDFPLRVIQYHVQRHRDLFGNLLLHRNGVFLAAVEVFRPQVKAVGRAHQLRGDTQALAGPAHRALDDVRHAHPRRDVLHRQVLPLEMERGGARGDQQLQQLRQRVQDFLGQAVGEVLVVGAAAQRGERQHGDGAERFRARRVPAVRALQRRGAGAPGKRS